MRHAALLLLAVLASCRFDLPPICGDGVADEDGGEECDDGNITNSDGCDSNCTITACGNGIANPGEECDAGSRNSNSASCTASCRLARCGDGFSWSGQETCDDGNRLTCGHCDATCSATRAGRDCPAGAGCRLNLDCTSNICLNMVCQ